MELGQAQERFLDLLLDLLLWVRQTHPTWKFRLGEGRVAQIRTVVVNGKKQRAVDAVHMTNSLHYSGLAQDLNLFVNGKFMASDCPEWREVGKKWQSLDPDCAWGGDWNDNGTPGESGESDFNHISLRWGGRK